MRNIGFILLAMVVGMFIGGALITENLDKVECVTSECFDSPIQIGGSK